MKKIYIIIGSILIIIVTAIWLFFFIYGAPQSGGIFTKFTGGPDTQNSSLNQPQGTVDVSPQTEAGKPQNLRQLTTRPVAGASFTSSNEILYVEQGTGHIYNINLTTGTESLISATTIPQAIEAVFSLDGISVAISTYENMGRNTLVSTVPTGTSGDTALKGSFLPKGARDISFGKTPNIIFYRLLEDAGSSGYSYTLSTSNATRLFTIPLQDVRVLWGDYIYVYTTPAAGVVGHIYKINKDELAYVTEGEKGLMGFMFHDNPIVTYSGEGSLTSYIVGGTEEVSIPILPEKCVAGKLFLYCASPYNLEIPNSNPDSWYKGVISYSDILWGIDTTAGESAVISNFELESGREIDVSKIGISSDETSLYFINKNDNTLWMYASQVSAR
ncbi:MAG: hypothetical protein K9M10_02450 [Candidatus Pacebacteria bacterium]|nr:hypothetical protein [Candidatus Paceibacterota bacterium]MCF7857316.1 hypothetical protein [Candidatus Paceibacterota bacterium]